jgi:uncharacterized HAD superfamily protein
VGNIALKRREKPDDGLQVIDPASIAFDIDGVVADTMRLFLQLAERLFKIRQISYEEITSYNLEECLGAKLDADIIQAIVKRLIDGDYDEPLVPIKDAPRVLARIARQGSPLLFITARPYPGPMMNWLADVLPVEAASIEVIATGSFESKADVLLARNISCFIEDRLETCFHLQTMGIRPVLFSQPWNRAHHPFLEVASWRELETFIDLQENAI